MHVLMCALAVRLAGLRQLMCFEEESMQGSLALSQEQAAVHVSTKALSLGLEL